MISGALARRYARALLGLAESPAERDRFAQELAAMADLVRRTDDTGTPLTTVLTAERFALSDRKALLGALAHRIGATPIVLRFLEHVLTRGRIDGLLQIARAYERLADDAAQRVQATLTSASPLPTDAVARITSALERATGKTVIVHTAIDPELIGGVVAKIGSYVIDGSVRSTLAKLRQHHG